MPRRPAGLPRRRQLPRLHGRGQGRARAGGLLHPQADRRHGGADADRARREVARDGVRAAREQHAAARARAPTTRRRSGNGRRRWALPAASAMPRSSTASTSTAELDVSNPAIAVNLDACISCGACVRACREVQVNDVIGMGLRGSHAVPGVRHPRPDGPLDLRHVRRVRAGVPDRRALREVADGQDGDEARRAEVRQGRRHAVSVLRRRLSDVGRRQGQPDRAGRRPQRLRERESALRQRPLRLRLCRLARAPDEAADPPRRRAEDADDAIMRVRRPLQRVPRSDLGRGADARRRRAQEDPRRARRQSAVGLRLGEGLERGGVLCSRSSCARASRPTTSITARGCAMPRRSRRSWKASARAPCRRRSMLRWMPSASSSSARGRP